VGLEDDALYLRSRLLRLHEMNRIVYPKKRWAQIERCIIESTRPAAVKAIARSVLSDTFSEELERRAEWALIDAFGPERYRSPGLLRRHVLETLGRYRVQLLMTAVMTTCGAPLELGEDEALEMVAYNVGRPKGREAEPAQGGDVDAAREALYRVVGLAMPDDGGPNLERWQMMALEQLLRAKDGQAAYVEDLRRLFQQASKFGPVMDELRVVEEFLGLRL
jgi:hypothetical protein